ncbi:MAG: lipopolysaccharide biosynthesis protein RfbH [Candidatus Rokubacteria bacterium]|nr:lipopolysaccharide biosynthesis protein RfbH [Candidatus Rokubacteria bacterium]
MTTAGDPEEGLRAEIRERVRRLVRERLARATFTPGESVVQYAGRIYDDAEVVNAVEASLDFWLTLGPYGDRFERKLATTVGGRHVVLVNSGSSANLIALSALTSPKLERPLVPGDEVITVAAGFPTTINPIVQNGCVPVFVDVLPATHVADPDVIEAAVGPRTRAVMMAHTLGNPFDVDAVREICRRHDLYLVEDNCDALGSTFKGRMTGTFGDVGTLSFYPAHHITMGEGGAVLTNDGRLKVILESFRDWGRDCWCPPGQANTCGKRFEWQLGDLPCGYDHKYAYVHRGYNLKPTDIQAAIGVAQLDKLEDFVRARREHWAHLRKALAPFEDVLELPEPTPGSDPAWFGFFFLVREAAPFTRDDLVRALEARRVQTRMLFGGNMLKQPAYLGVAHRVVGPLTQTDRLLDRGMWVGVYAGLRGEPLRYMTETLVAEIQRLTRGQVR